MLIQLVAKVLEVLVLGPTLLLLLLELLEDLLASSLSLGLLSLDFGLTAFLLLGVAAKHLVFVLLELLLLTEELSLLGDRLDHVELGLLLLHADERDHPLVFFNHLRDHLVHLVLLLKVLLVGFGAELSLHLHLVLQVVLLLQGKALALLFLLALDEVLELLLLKHLLLHRCVKLLHKKPLDRPNRQQWSVPETSRPELSVMILTTSICFRYWFSVTWVALSLFRYADLILF